MEQLTLDPYKLYDKFCKENKISPLSFEELADRMNISMNALLFSINGMILYYPDSFKKIHEKSKQKGAV